MLKRMLLLGACAALALGAGVRVATTRWRHAPRIPVPVPPAETATADQTPSPAAPGSRHPRWVAAWTRPTPDLRDLSLAPDGANLAWVDSRGIVRRVSTASGTTLWQSTPMANVNGVVAVPGGDVLAFSRLNPMDTNLHRFAVAASSAITSPPPRVSVIPVSGAIWSVAAAPRGDRVLVGTGHSTLVVVPLPAAAPSVPAGQKTVKPPSTLPSSLPASPSPRQIATQGIPESIAISDATASAGAAAIIAGTWQDAGVGAWGANGAPLWPPHDDARPDQTYEVHLSADGATVLAISARRPHGLQPRIHVWDGKSGRLAWGRQILDPTDDMAIVTDAHALVSANGGVIALSYAAVAPDAPPGTTPTRKLVLFNRLGIKFFADKGVHYFAPQLVALSADGADVTVRDGSGSLRILDDRGRILSHTPLAPDPKTGRVPTVRATFVSADGRALLLQRGDGQVTFFKASAS